MSKRVGPKEKRSKTVSVTVTTEEYAALRAYSWLTNQTLSMILHDWLEPYILELLKRSEIRKAMGLGRPLVAPPTKDEIELRDLASWLEKDRLSR